MSFKAEIKLRPNKKHYVCVQFPYFFALCFTNGNSQVGTTFKLKIQFMQILHESDTNIQSTVRNHKIHQF